MHWHWVVEKEGVVIYDEEGYMSTDAFELLDKACAAHVQNNGGQLARVSATVQRSLQYGELKCSFTVAVSCPQNQAALDAASSACFTIATQYVNNGMSWLAPGLPTLNVPR
jgi:hypothetical protein